MKRFCNSITAGLLLFGAQSLMAEPLSGSKPNIVVFLIDDLGWMDLSCNGSKVYQTPNIDQLAANGVRFTNAYSACTVCSPTRAALMTGKYPARLHITDWIQGHKKPFAKLAVPDWTMFLPLKETTIAESLAKAGYATWHVGKWHLGDDEKYWPENQGFDINIAGNYKGSPNKDNSGHNGYFSPYGLARISDGPDGEYLTDRLTSEAVTLINSAGKQPFYLNFCHYAVHTPLMAKPEKLEKYKSLQKQYGTKFNAVYASMIESVDESVGNVLKALDNRHLLENTLIVFASDNGALESSGSSAPLRHGKGWAYEGGIRTPLLVCWNGKIMGHRILDEPVITMDIYSTILDVAGIKQKKDVDGLSLIPVLMDNKHYNRPLFWHYPHYHLGKPHGSVRMGDWKLIEFFEDNNFELYNLKDDLGETTNLADKYPEKVAELKKLLFKWRKKVGAQMMTPNPKFNPEKANQSRKEKGEAE